MAEERLDILLLLSILPLAVKPAQLKSLGYPARVAVYCQPRRGHGTGCPPHLLSLDDPKSLDCH